MCLRNGSIGADLHPLGAGADRGYCIYLGRVGRWRRPTRHHDPIQQSWVGLGPLMTPSWNPTTPIETTLP